MIESNVALAFDSPLGGFQLQNFQLVGNRLHNESHQIRPINGMGTLAYSVKAAEEFNSRGSDWIFNQLTANYYEWLYSVCLFTSLENP